MSTCEMLPRDSHNCWGKFRGENERVVDFSNLHYTNESHSVTDNTIPQKGNCKCIQALLLNIMTLGSYRHLVCWDQGR